jgi:hypothetical protein
MLARDERRSLIAVRLGQIRPYVVIEIPRMGIGIQYFDGVS